MSQQLSRLLILSMLGLSCLPAAADSECKGLDQNACTAKEQCRWMDGYTRKDGVQVSSHCRLSKPRKTSEEVSLKDKTQPE